MTAIKFESLQIPILAFGRSWLVLDKPAGMSVHNAPGRDICSVVFAFIHNDSTIQKQIDIEPEFGVNPVHRLDRETSGVILLATNRDMFRFFSNQFETRQVKKKYVAILHGKIEKSNGNELMGKWNWATAKTSGGRSNPEGSGKLEYSETHYRIIDYSIHYTMAEIEILTGRTHQIRRHAKLAGHPVVGDSRYGSARALNYLRQNCGFDRLALHACSLTLQVSVGKKPETIETPTIPSQIMELFENDREETLISCRKRAKMLSTDKIFHSDKSA